MKRLPKNSLGVYTPRYSLSHGEKRKHREPRAVSTLSLCCMCTCGRAGNSAHSHNNDPVVRGTGYQSCVAAASVLSSTRARGTIFSSVCSGGGYEAKLRSRTGKATIDRNCNKGLRQDTSSSRGGSGKRSPLPLWAVTYKYKALPARAYHSYLSYLQNDEPMRAQPC